MHLKQVFVILLAMFNLKTAGADLYFEVAAESGGDELIQTNSIDSISAGGGVKLAIGIQNPVNFDGTAALRLSAGYLFDHILAGNGQANFNTITFDAMFVTNSGPHSVGLGATVHMSPEYSDKVDGYRSELIEFEDAAGLVMQYSYHFVQGLELGVRYTDLTYEQSTIRTDAASLGIFLSNGFL